MAKPRGGRLGRGGLVPGGPGGSGGGRSGGTQGGERWPGVMGVTTGSFYWHFSCVAEFRSGLLEYWEGRTWWLA